MVKYIYIGLELVSLRKLSDIRLSDKVFYITHVRNYIFMRMDYDQSIVSDHEFPPGIFSRLSTGYVVHLPPTYSGRLSGLLLGPPLPGFTFHFVLGASVLLVSEPIRSR